MFCAILPYIIQSDLFFKHYHHVGTASELPFSCLATQMQPGLSRAAPDRYSSSILSTGNGGIAMGRMAMDISFTGLSSAAMRFELKAPHLLHRCMIAHSLFFFTHTATGSM